MSFVHMLSGSSAAVWIEPKKSAATIGPPQSVLHCAVATKGIDVSGTCEM